MKIQGHTHLGKCTDGPVFSREQAEDKLRRTGWRKQDESAEWVRGDVRGRLGWIPDSCDEEPANEGTFWFL